MRYPDEEPSDTSLLLGAAALIAGNVLVRAGARSSGAKGVVLTTAGLLAITPVVVSEIKKDVNRIKFISEQRKYGLLK